MADNGLRTWNCGIGEEKVGLDWDLVSGTGICVIDRPRVGLDPVIKLCPPARLNSKAEMTPWSWEQKYTVHCCAPVPRTVPGTYWELSDGLMGD